MPNFAADVIGIEDRARLLIVEDEAATRDMLLALLQRANYDVTAVATAAEARRVLSRDAVDLVLLDLNLPDNDGLDLDRAFARRRDFGVIIVTARSDVIDRIIGLELGADDYLIKPFDPRELLARVRALLRRFKSQRAGRRQAVPAKVAC
jgi:DNA-binding response OmpR family regulator